MSERYWFPLYRNDWRSKFKLRLISFGAKGLWIELLCMIYKADDGGKLTINGNPPTPETLHRLLGLAGEKQTEEAMTLLKELEIMGVYQIKDGAIYSEKAEIVLDDMKERTSGYKPRRGLLSPFLNPSHSLQDRLGESWGGDQEKAPSAF